MLSPPTPRSHVTPSVAVGSQWVACHTLGRMRPSSFPPVALAAVALAFAGGVGACGTGGDGRDEVTVLAASSLTAVFDDLETAFEQSHPDVDLVVSTVGSPSLAAQAAEGAPAALLITADARSMARADDADVLDGAPRAIATNRVTVATPTDGADARVDRVADLAQPGVIVALCAPEVPCGRAALDFLRAARVDVDADSLESSVRGVVTRLTLGEVDAGVVYRTDVSGSDGDLRSVPDGMPDEVGAVRYLAAPLGAEPGGRTLLDFLIGPAGRRILTDHGFGEP